MTHSARRSIVEQLADLYRGGGATPVDVAQACLDRASDPDAHSVLITRSGKRALTQARASRKRHTAGQSRGMLDGVPIVYKDLIDVSGMATTCGSRALPHGVKRQSASVVRTLEGAGGITIGKANLSEFAFSGLGLNAHYGTPVNPWSRPGEARICGGSSSGCAAAVARAIAAVAIGTDTSGSVRIPAAFCGLVGFRPTTNRYSRRGVADLAPTLDSVGTIVPTVGDALTLDGVLCPSNHSQTGAMPSRIRIAWVGPSQRGAVDAEVEAACEQWLGSLRAAGIAVHRAHWPALDDALEGFRRHGTLVAAEASHSLRAFIDPKKIECIDAPIGARLMQASRMAAADVVALYQLRSRLLDAERRQADDIVLALPAAPCVAPRLADVDERSFPAINSRVLSFTMPVSFLDRPAIAVPCGWTTDGFPVGVQLVGARGADRHLLTVAAHLERRGLVATRWLASLAH